MNLKPFDLERAKAGDPVVTRDGRKVRIVCFDRKARQPVIVLYEQGTHEEVEYVGADGRYCLDNGVSPYDLFMAPKKRKIAVNVFRKADGLETSGVFDPDGPNMGKIETGYLVTLTGEIEE